MQTDAGPDADTVRDTERERLRALVAADMDVADRLHASDFQLITPSGMSLSKAEYLGGIATGHLDYRVWEPGEITTRLHGDVALVRYQADLQIAVGGKLSHLGRYWHTDTYERRDGRWQVVWSQATEIT
jgi:hypothetical protein